MNDNKWITTDNRSGKLQIRFKVKGYPKQFFLATGLVDTASNRELVQQRRDLIAADISLGRFDASLERYQFTSRITTSNRVESKVGYQLDLAQLWAQFTEYKKAMVETTTIYANYRCTARYIAKFPDCRLENAAKIRDWLLKNSTHYMAWQLLLRFSECCDWGVASGLIPDNPFTKLKIKRPKRKSNSEDYQAFTREQRDLIIQAFEEHHIYHYHAPLIKFLFWTGARLGEAFALTWGDIGGNCTRIEINKSCNRYHIKKGTKNGKRRVFPAKEGSKLQQMLLEIKPPPESYRPSELVFKTITGRPLTSDSIQNFWNGHSKNKNSKFYPGVVRSLADAGQVPYLKPYSTRHTFATWAIASGITPDRVALWIGDEVQTVLKFYCHPNIVDSECPDF
jgi:integrase